MRLLLPVMFLYVSGRRCLDFAGTLKHRNSKREDLLTHPHLLVALNVDDAPLRLVLAELDAAHAQVLAGSAAPPSDVVDAVDVEPRGWRILRLVSD
jgi:hypothetical protein